MGYIPIFIALLAFVVLLILVNLNSIQSLQRSLGLALLSACQTAKSRNALLKRLTELPENRLCPALPPDHKISSRLIPRIVDFVAAEWISLKESEHQIKITKTSPPTLRYVQSLQLLNQRQHINLRTFERKAREYNRMIESYPTRMVAILFNIKPIRLPASRK